MKVKLLKNTLVMNIYIRINIEKLWGLWYYGNEHDNRGPYRNIKFSNNDRANYCKAKQVMDLLSKTAKAKDLPNINEQTNLDACLLSLRDQLSISNASYHGTNKINQVSYSTFYLDWNKMLSNKSASI